MQDGQIKFGDYMPVNDTVTVDDLIAINIE